MAGYTLWNKKICSDIRDQLGIFNINDKLTQCKYIGRNIYEEWMTTDYPKKILNYKPEGRRTIGRLQTRWGHDFREEGTGQEA